MWYDSSGRFAIALTTTAVAAVCLSGITVCAVKIADIVSSNLSSTTLFPDMTIDIPDVTIYEPDFYGDTHRDEFFPEYNDVAEEEEITAYFSKNSDPDPYRRPGQKKQERERKEKKKDSNKGKGNKNWNPNPNKRIMPPKKHTPGRDHRKYFK